MKNFNKTKIKRYINKLNVSIFAFRSKATKDYSPKNAAEIHDNSLIWLCKTNRVSEKSFRQNIISKLNIKKESRVLIVGAGAGNDIPFVKKKIGPKGKIYAQDISEPMILEAAKRYNFKNKPKIHFSVSDACDLPYKDKTFDITFHFGGINLFSNIKKGINEMSRVTKPNGTIMFGDEGIGEWLRSTTNSKALINNNSLYSFRPPISYLPLSSKNVTIEWVLNNTFYLIKFTKGEKNWSINTNVEHKGIRGGSIKTRYFGKLEGINPILRNKFYQKIKKQNESRVSVLEKIINDYLKNHK